MTIDKRKLKKSFVKSKLKEEAKLKAEKLKPVKSNFQSASKKEFSKIPYYSINSKKDIRNIAVLSRQVKMWLNNRGEKFDRNDNSRILQLEKVKSFSENENENCYQ